MMRPFLLLLCSTTLVFAFSACGGDVVWEPGDGEGGQSDTGAGSASGSCPPIGAACECGEGLLPGCPIEFVEGIPCCDIGRYCAGEENCVVAWSGAICHVDYCEVKCELAEDPDQCIAIGCELTDNGCKTPPEP